jgi:hypothetical protein
LRYSVSGDYKINPIDPAILLIKIPPTVGHFVIHDENNTPRVGALPSEYALAVVFAAHNIVPGQSRTVGAGPATACGSKSFGAAINQANNYLEALNNVSNSTGTYAGPGIPGSAALPTTLASVFIQAGEQTNYNDALIWLTPADYIVVHARLP